MSASDLPELFYVHPCLHKAAARWFGRIHLPVAPECNIKCRYCTRKFDCANENRPGATSRILSPGEALQVTSEEVQRDPRLRVVGIAGPGDPLDNPATFETLELVHNRFPHLIKCISTNGLLLVESLPGLYARGVRVVTVTVNAVSPAVGVLIYEHVQYHGRIYRDATGVELLLQAQLAGIERASGMGMVVKVNTVYIPMINDSHLIEVALKVKKAGAHVMNLVPLIPMAQFAGLQPPGRQQILLARQSLVGIISQVEHCRQCRADAVGMLCQSGDEQI
ncbi:MAG: radical SAM protein [Thermacetogeniaceae bacterium]